MPKGPKGEKRPADVIGAAIMVAKIATGEVEEIARDPGKGETHSEVEGAPYSLLGAEWAATLAPESHGWNNLQGFEPRRPCRGES